MERRTIELELTADPENVRTLRGRAMVYNQDGDLGKFTERILPGAVSKALEQEKNIVALYEHDRRSVLGSTRNGSLRFTDGPEGLDFELDVAETSVGNDVLALVNSGEIRGMSFGFKAAPDGTRWSRSQGKLSREVRDISRFPEITVTVDPAYEGTTIALRSIDPDTLEEVKRIDESPTLAERKLRFRKLAFSV